MKRVGLFFVFLLLLGGCGTETTSAVSRATNAAQQETDRLQRQLERQEARLERQKARQEARLERRLAKLERQREARKQARLEKQQEARRLARAAAREQAQAEQEAQALAAAPSSGCDYDPCLAPASDYDCAGGSGDGPAYTGYVRVIGGDPYDLDSDGDGVGCES